MLWLIAIVFMFIVGFWPVALGLVALWVLFRLWLLALRWMVNHGSKHALR